MKTILLKLDRDGRIFAAEKTGWNLAKTLAWQSGYNLDATSDLAKKTVPPERGLLTSLAIRNNTVEITSDHAGAYPVYLARAQSGDLFLGNLAWQVARSAELRSLDEDACFQLLAFEYVTGGKTLVEGLFELKAACVHRFAWRESSWQQGEQRYWRLSRRTSPIETASDETQAIENLRHQTDPISDFARKASAPLVLNLSGGWDSRALLGGLYPLGPKHLFTCTYGNPEFDGVRIARTLSESLGIPNRFFPFPDGQHLKNHFRKLITAAPPVARFNLVDGGYLVAQNFYGNICAACAGHSGDIFTSLPPVGDPSALESPQGQADRMFHNAAGAWPQSILEPLLNPSSRHLSRIPRMAMEESVRESFVPGYAGIFRWKLENRIRRGVITELRVLQRTTGTIFLPMLHKSFLEFWVNRSNAQLKNQMLYRRALGNKLFTGPATVLRTTPREGGGFLMSTGPFRTGLSKLGKKSRAALRRISPATIGKRTMADPTELWWETDTELRSWAIRMIADSEFLRSRFDADRLVKFLENSNRLYPWLARIGVWNMLTIAGVEQELTDPSRPDSFFQIED